MFIAMIARISMWSLNKFCREGQITQVKNHGNITTGLEGYRNMNDTYSMNLAPEMNMAYQKFSKMELWNCINL